MEINIRYTLKEMVDVILSSMDSDEVNSISDTVESNQVALLIQSVYYDIASQLNLPEHNTMFELVASGDSTKPCMMTLPTNCVSLDNLRYDYKLTTETYKNYQPVKYCDPDTFIRNQASLRTQTTGVGEQELTFNGDTVSFMYYSNKMPTYYTVVGDNTLVFDAYDSDEDTTLVADKTLATGWVYPDFTLSDSFAPNLDPTQFSYFMNKCKVRAFAELKQVDNAEARSETRQQLIQVQRNERRTPDLREVYKTSSRFGRK